MSEHVYARIESKGDCYGNFQPGVAYRAKLLPGRRVALTNSSGGSWDGWVGQVTMVDPDTLEGPAPDLSKAKEPLKAGSQVWQAQVMEKVFQECRLLREEGQKEYAHDEANAFANFEADSGLTGVTRETSLLIFMTKHIRGIASWVKGHRSQRESVKGRINDAIVYLTLLRGMVEQEEKEGGE